MHAAELVIDTGGIGRRAWRLHLAATGTDDGGVAVAHLRATGRGRQHGLRSLGPRPSLPIRALRPPRKIGQPEFDDFDEGIIDAETTKLSTLTDGERFAFEFDLGDPPSRESQATKSPATEPEPDDGCDPPEPFDPPWNDTTGAPGGPTPPDDQAAWDLVGE